MIDEMIKSGTLKSYTYRDGKEEIYSKPAPSWQVTFRVVDKKLLQQKKASKLVDIDIVVPQDKLPYVFTQITEKIQDITASRKAPQT